MLNKLENIRSSICDKLTFLFRMWSGRIPVRNKVVKIILVKGVPLLGTIEGYDKFSIIIKVNGKQQTLYKHAISTIVQ